jgi:hypothetical protein
VINSLSHRSLLLLSAGKADALELLWYFAVCYSEHVALLLCTLYTERRHELEEGRRSAAGAPFDSILPVARLRLSRLTGKS